MTSPYNTAIDDKLDRTCYRCWAVISIFRGNLSYHLPNTWHFYTSPRDETQLVLYLGVAPCLP